MVLLEEDLEPGQKSVGCRPHLQKELCTPPWPQRNGLLLHLRPGVPGLSTGSAVPVPSGVGECPRPTGGLREPALPTRLARVTRIDWRSGILFPVHHVR